MLKNAYLLAHIGADTAENEQQFAEILTAVWQKLAAASVSGSRGGNLRGRQFTGIRRIFVSDV